jgi:pyruvate/2-oxoglutarate dehydrogenase complex dihydrolipoamide dehydrogenase (E3) component
MLDLIVLGGGPAGVTAALRARELGASCALVEQNRMGGTCTNDGCVPTRVLAKAARLLRDYSQFSDYGIHTAPPSIDFVRLIQRTQQVVYSIHEKKQLINVLQQAGVQVHAGVGPAQFIDLHTLALADGSRLHAQKFVLCVGGQAARLKFPGAEHAITHSDVWSLKKLPRSVAIIGAAATGCQLASIFSAFGSSVTLLEVAPTILPREDPTTSLTMRQAFESHGICILTGIGGVERIVKKPSELELHYTQGGKEASISAEVVIMAVGWPGKLGGLNLEAAGVEVERGYVRVDDRFRTSAGHIYAAGDITGRMMLVQSAGHEARVATENAILGERQPYSHYIVPHGGFTDPEYGSVGLTEADACEMGGCLVAQVRFSDLDRAIIDGHPEGFCKLIVDQQGHRILGAHVVGEQALETIQLVAAGMAAGITVEQMAELEIAYPTYAAVVGLAARQLVRQLGLLPLSPQWRALQKPHAAEWEASDINN